VTPTVTEECAKIRDVERRELHDSFIAILINESQIKQTDYIELRVKELERYHNGKNDCRILAEAEDAEFQALLTYDNHFFNRLQGVSSIIKIFRPTEYWNQLYISHGAKPDKRPHASNPLVKQKWWEW
jgi:predicted nucleic acid-binding protein